ncbi:PIN domain-like protein [Coprinopsis marcescibilis]|uniref:PIN domain-like protein n=1 Tax=Coprinopsis marcescibilis TaxID=230819 RepID=A0A5C3KUQ9_COPMA|nr:PIN domain-like protein [Coprinopsis marcescibilis]
MGVHGLTTYLRENRRQLSTTITLQSQLAKNQIPIVVDGWSFIYALYRTPVLASIPWIYGGEYPEFENAVKNVVAAWLRVGLKVHFVFDGAYPDLKFPTLVTRLSESHVQHSLLFFRTSAASRTSPSSLRETWMLPPLSYTVCIHALKQLQATTDLLELHFADEEGDPYAVELAGRIGGYVVGYDSDFLVFNSEGYQGYIPVDEMVWKTPNDEAVPIEENDGEFQVVRKVKHNRKAPVESSLLPPDAEELELHVTAYSPSRLASHLNLPVTLLPLLGALVGNDFSAESETHRRRLQSLFFERNLSITQRIGHAAKVIRSILAPNAVRRKPKHEVGSVMDLIDRTVNALLVRHSSNLGTGEVEKIIDGVVEATLQYAIPKADPNDSPLWPTELCALHTPDTCSFLPMVSRRLLTQLQAMDEEDQELLQVREALIHAYRQGSLSPKIMDPLNTSSSWPRPFLEHPDVETVNRSIGRPIREWIYSILDDAAGLPDPLVPESSSSQSEHEESESDDDELIDVVEDDSEDEDADLLAPLKGELNRLHGSEDETSQATTDPPPSITSSQRLERKYPPTITEYIRRGARVASEEITVTPLRNLLESVGLEGFSASLLLLRPEEDRFTVLLRLLNSDTQSVRALRPEQLAPVLALRWTATVLSKRAEETGSRERDQERWATTEARCWLASFGQTQEEQVQSDGTTTITDRNIQLMAQMLVALDNIDQLAEILLIGHRVPSTAHLLSGRLFHALLNAPSTLGPPEDDFLWSAVKTDLQASFQEPKPKRFKKAKQKSEAVSSAKPPQKAQKGQQGFFALLDLDTR